MTLPIFIILVLVCALVFLAHVCAKASREIRRLEDKLGLSTSSRRRTGKKLVSNVESFETTLSEGMKIFSRVEVKGGDELDVYYLTMQGAWIGQDGKVANSKELQPLLDEWFVEEKARDRARELDALEYKHLTSSFTGKKEVLSDNEGLKVTSLELTPEAQRSLSTGGARIPEGK